MVGWLVGGAVGDGDGGRKGSWFFGEIGRVVIARVLSNVGGGALGRCGSAVLIVV